MKKMLFICNPVSGRGISGADFFRAISYFEDQNYIVTIIFLKKEMDLVKYLSEYGPEYELVCSGGDGMLHLMANILQKTGQTRTVTYIPNGTTNDFARSLGIDTNFERALTVIEEDTTQVVDIGKFNEEYFVYVAAFGAFTDVSYTTPQKNKNMFGYFAYVFEGIKKLSELKPYHIVAKIEDEVIEDDIIVGLITNTTSVAGLKVMEAGKSSVDDGLFEMILIKQPENIMDFQAIIKALLSGSIDEKHFYYRQVKKLEIISEKEINYTLDGEYGGSHKRIVIENYPRAFTIRA